MWLWLSNLICFIIIAFFVVLSYKKDFKLLEDKIPFNPYYLLYGFIGLNIFFYLMVVYYIFDIEKAIQTGRLLQLECSNTPVTYEKETVRYSMDQYFKNDITNKIIQFIAIACTLFAHIMAGMWLLTRPKSGKTVFAGLYLIFWIGIALFSSFVAGDVKIYQNPDVEKARKFFDSYLNGREAGQTQTQLFRKVLERYMIANNETNQGSATISVKDVFVDYIDFSKDYNNIISIINSAEACNDISQSIAFNNNNLCLGANYKTTITKAINNLHNFNHDEYTRQLYDKTARARYPFLLFMVLFLAFFYDNILCDKYSFTQISFGAIGIVFTMILVIFILRYVGVLVR